jgi:ABC-type transporter Mla subunit MlaD
MARDNPLGRQALGAAVLLVGTTVTVGLFALATGDPWGDEIETVTAHFSSVTGLKKNSDVLLSGKPVGRVDEVSFITVRYHCNPATEDRGLDPTNDCEPWFYCAGQTGGDGLCAELVPYSGNTTDYDEKGCLVDDQCVPGEVCVNDAFRRRNGGVDWYGPRSTCVPFETNHHRVEVTMSVATDKVEFIRSDSRASIASKGVLGDQTVNITVGSGREIPEGGRLQSAPTLLEELNRFRARVGAITERFSGNLAGLRGVQGSMRREKKNAHDKPDTRSALSRASDATTDIVQRQGQLGELFQDSARDDFIASLHDLQGSTDQTRRDIINWRRDVVPDLRKTSNSLGEFADSTEAALDPNSESTGARLLTDERLGNDIAGRVEDTAKTLTSARRSLDDVQEGVDEVRRQLDAGEGVIGELVRSPSMYYEFVKVIALFDMFDRNDGFKSLAREVVQAADDWEDADPKQDGIRPRVRDEAAPAQAPDPPPRKGPPPPPPPPPKPEG